jgi:subtilisin family serine protease
MSRSTITSVVLALLVLLGTLAGTPALGIPGVGDDSPFKTDWPGVLTGPARESLSPVIWLRAGIFDPLEDPMPLTMDLDGSSSRGIYLVQFNGPLSSSVGERLTDAGGRVLAYVPDSGLVVKFQRPSSVLPLALWGDVRWLAPWQDGWKVDPTLDGMVGPIDLGIVQWGGAGDISPDIRSLGARVLNHQLDLYVVRADARLVPSLARLDGVSWIERWGTPEILMDNAARSIGARQKTDGAFDPEGTAVWAYDNITDTFSGITGSSVTVSVTDTGVDGSHNAFAGRNHRYWSLIPTLPAWSDPRGHGTHVAGIVLGDGSYRSTEDDFYHDNFDGKYAGVAPGAYLVAQSLYGPGLNFTYRNVTKWSVENDAMISQNSWGNLWSGYYGNYTIASRDYDNSTRDADWETPGNQSILVVFSSGNAGLNGNNTLTPNAAAKNVIAVGATGNGKNVTGEDEVYLLSSKGYADDGRIKPDLVAPGDDVVSTWGIDDDGSSGTLPPDAGDHSYIMLGGTSMSAPVVSGSAALVMDYLITKEGKDDPSPAVVKSILIASADHLDTTPWPGREQGWGKVNASRAIVETRDSNMEFVDQTTKFYGVGESQSYRYDVQAGTPLRVALVWTDLPSHVFAGKMLINDLDLEVKSPSGTVYKGNVFSNGLSTPGGSADDVNNVEMVYLDAPESGEWEVTVRSSQLPPVWGGGNQDFAVAVVGNVNKKFVDIAAQNLSVRATDAAEGDTIPIIFDLANLGNLPAASVRWQLNILDEFGNLHERLDEGFMDIEPRSGIRMYRNWSAVRGEFTIKVVPNPTRLLLEESYQNNNVSKKVFIKGFGVSGKTNETSLDGMPGTDVTFTLEVTNEGNVEDLFLLSRSEPPSGWNARLDVTFLDILPGATKQASLIVTVPQGLLAWEFAKVDVTVVSQGNSSHFIVLGTQTNVAQIYDLSLVLETRSIDAAPGEDAVFDFSLTNIGNTNDTYKVTYWQQSGPTTGVDFEINRSTFATPVGVTNYGRLTVSLDAGAVDKLPAGVSITFVIKAESARPNTISKSDTASVIIEPLMLIEITPPDSERYFVGPNEDMTFTIDISNYGNGANMVTPSVVVPEGWEWRSAEPSVFLEPGETKTIQMWVTVSSTADAGSHDIDVVASVDEPEDSIPLRFIVDWIPDIEVRLDGSYDRNLTLGQELTMNFRVTNSGNDQDSITVEFSGLTQGLTAEARPMGKDLAMDEIGTFVVVFTADENAKVTSGQYRVTFIYAGGGERDSVIVNISVQGKVIDDDPQKPENGDDDGGIPIWVFGLIGAVVIVVLLAVFLMKSSGLRRDDAKLEESFFKDDRHDEATSAVLEEEMASRRGPPPPPPSEAAPAPAVEASEWEESGPAASTAEPAPVAAPTGGKPCPSCGNSMQSLGPGGGSYCPSCGHQEGG